MNIGEKGIVGLSFLGFALAAPGFAQELRPASPLFRKAIGTVVAKMGEGAAHRSSRSAAPKNLSFASSVEGQATRGGGAEPGPVTGPLEPQPVSMKEERCPSSNASECPSASCVSSNPSDCPSLDPDNCNSVNPSDCPSVDPDDCPSADPDDCPSVNPPDCPSLNPSDCPSFDPSSCPSSDPSQCPSIIPGSCPTTNLADCMSLNLADCPSLNLSSCPSLNPADCPSLNSASCPSINPADCPSLNPSSCPSVDSAQCPSLVPSPNCVSFNPDQCSTINPQLCDEEVCCNPLLCRPNDGEAEIDGLDEEHYFLVMSETPSISEGFYVTHRIVTIETGRQRDLPGKLRLNLFSGDSTIVEITRTQTGAVYSLGSPISVLETGHVGCGVHTWHQGWEHFGLKPLKPGSLVLEAVVDPDPEFPEGDGQPTKRAKIHIHVHDLDVDTNRDGTINDSDEQGENNWTKTLGALFNVNFDNDGSGTTPDAIDINNSGSPVSESFTIDSGGDTSDIAKLAYGDPGSDPLPTDAQVFLKAVEAEDPQSFHLYKKIASGETSIWGSRTGSAPIEFDITPYVNPGSGSFQGGSGVINLGLEGLLFRNTASGPLAFDGYIDLTMEVRRAGAVKCSDSVRLKVGPWIGQPHTQSSFETWAMDAGSLNDEFLHSSAAPPGHVGIDDSGQLHTASGGAAGTQWFQDHLEAGWNQRPGGPQAHSILRLPYGSQPTWAKTQLLKPNQGVFQLKNSFGAVAGDFGGNVEVLTPTGTYPMGRMVVGSTASASLVQFFNDQEVQGPVVQPPTAWLRVSHVDEMFGFSNVSGQVVISDTDLAYSLMNSIPVADRGKAVFFATGSAPTDGAVTAPTPIPNRIITGIDHTGQPWLYIRIYRDSIAGSGGAAGQLAQISTLGVGYIDVSLVWNTTSKLVPPLGATGTPCIYNRIKTGIIPTSVWAVPPAVGDRYVLVEDSRWWIAETSSYDFPSIVTVEEVLADADFQTLNKTNVKGKLDATKAILNSAAGSALGYTSVPVLYFGYLDSFDSNREGLAMTPGASNFQLAAGSFYFPGQFGFKNSAGTDLFRQQIETAVPGAKFVDCWDLYHALMGEVHCGTASLRGFPGLNWWENQP